MQLRFLHPLCGALLVAGSSASAIEIGDLEAAAYLCSYAEPVEDPTRPPTSLLDRLGALTGLEDEVNAESIDRREPTCTCEHALIESGGRDPLVNALVAREYNQERVQLLMETHSARLPGHEFALLPYDATLEVQSIALPFETAFLDGGAVLELGSDTVLDFAASPALADELATLRAMDGTALVLHFTLSRRDPDLPFCEIGADGDMRIPAELRRAELLESASGRILASVELSGTDALPEERQAPSGDPGLPAGPTALVTSLVLTGDSLLSRTEATLVQVAFEVRALECYVRALRENPLLQGALVIGFGSDASGTLAAPVVLVDVLDDERVSACLLAAVPSISLPEGQPGPDEVEGRATVVLRQR